MLTETYCADGKKIDNPLCIYCGKVESTIHIYYECANVNNMWKELGKILKLDISWKHLVLGVRGNNLVVCLRNMLFTTIMYALFKNWCNDIDNKMMYQPNTHVMNCKRIILKDIFLWNSIIKKTDNKIHELARMWQSLIKKILQDYM